MAKGVHRPWFKFYPSDWAGDRKLRMCSIGARGLWIEMLCVMHEAEPYGYLVTDGHAVTTRQIAALAGITIAECGKYLAELESAGVYSRDVNRTIFSRRMVRDHEKAVQDRNNGKAGGNPKIMNEDKRGVNPPVNRNVMREDNDRDKAQSPEARNTTTETRGRALISAEAFDITGQLERACGFNLPEETPPGWAGCAMWVQKCLDSGWIGAVMVEAAKGVVKRKRNGFIENFKYLEKPLAEAMAQHLAPLPQVEVKQPEKVVVIANGKSESLASVAARLAESGVTFGERPRGLRADAGGDHVRLLSKG